MQNIRKTKSEIEEELKEPTANSRRNENADMQDKVNGYITSEEAVKAIQEFEQIIENKKSDIVWLAYYENQIFPKFKERESFVSMVLKLNVNKSTMIFKIDLKKMIDGFPKIKDS